MTPQSSIAPRDLKAIEQSSTIRRELAKESFHFIEDRSARFATIMAFR